MTTDNEVKDLIGNELKEGDYIAYAVRRGDVADMRIYQIVALPGQGKIKARMIKTSGYSIAARPSTLYSGKHAILLRDFKE